MRLSEETKQELIELLWDYMKRDPEHKDRRRTGWGTKTKEGLVASVERLFEQSEETPKTA